MNITKHFLRLGKDLMDLSRPRILGILNLTPDSFSDGGQLDNRDKLLKRAEEMIHEGVDILDIGAQSTRPGADLLSADEEIERLGENIHLLRVNFPEIPISIDTFYGKVVRHAADQGAAMANDISGGQFDPNLWSVVADTGMAYVLMHCPSEYKKMHEKKIEGDVLLDINYYFSEKVSQLLNIGITDILLDPGFGFGKTVEQQVRMLENLENLGYQGYPLFVGVSRKSFIYKPLGLQPHEIGKQTQEIHLKLLNKGARILRVHDVKATSETIQKYLNQFTD